MGQNAGMEEAIPEEQQRLAENAARLAMPWLFDDGATPVVTYTPPEGHPEGGGVYRGPGFSITLPGEVPQHSYRVLRCGGTAPVRAAIYAVTGQCVTEDDE